jgi:hypothetical protein
MGYTLCGLAFSTGSQAYSLDSIEFATGGNGGTGNLTLSLYAANASTHLPTSNSALASQTFSNIPFNYQPEVTAWFLNNFTLAANSSYVLAFSAPDVENPSLFATNSESSVVVAVGTSGLTFHGLAFNWDPWAGPYNSGAPLVKLTGTATSGDTVSAVPEASTSLGLLGLGAGGILTRRRSKRAA